MVESLNEGFDYSDYIEKVRNNYFWEATRDFIENLSWSELYDNFMEYCWKTMSEKEKDEFRKDLEFSGDFTDEIAKENLDAMRDCLKDCDKYSEDNENNIIDSYIDAHEYTVQSDLQDDQDYKDPYSYYNVRPSDF